MKAASIDTIQQVKDIFTTYLESNRQRKTQERYIILEEIYKRDDHFDAEQLFKEFKESEINISRATVYNTLELLVSCDLVTKHQFGKNQAQYEKSFGNKQHDHIICINCRKVVEFCDPRLQQIETLAGKLLNFEILHHSLNLYGICKDCKEK